MLSRYSEVKYDYSMTLGGCMHTCTTFNEVLFNLNDLFNLLNLSKDVCNRYKKKIDVNDKNNVNFERDGCKTCETFINIKAVSFIINLYRKDLCKQLVRTESIDYFIDMILQDYGKNKDEYYEGYDDLSYQYALESLKQFSESHDDELMGIVNIFENYTNCMTGKNHIAKFKTPMSEFHEKKEQERKLTLDYLINKVKEESGNK